MGAIFWDVLKIAPHLLEIKLKQTLCIVSVAQLEQVKAKPQNNRGPLGLRGSNTTNSCQQALSMSYKA